MEQPKFLLLDYSLLLERLLERLLDLKAFGPVAVAVTQCSCCSPVVEGRGVGGSLGPCWVCRLVSALERENEKEREVEVLN